ncbi:hypothetical protein [Furfurilactobacillus siliginis]|uniref:Beta-1,6-galactofuranosyltransferase n=1 Tax=Furfurilactobacillus siliginis TaxID=348151 RepID=A0A0R2L5B4_9LACO|nr:hypothetical protein [Furfurilactobacillus siliginis]KRN94109.1 glycosyl transferase galactofuranosyltransferase [Furfurilactobacillus siliginis]GEK29087.1 beta-1,6-galactofuranosyltransferase [Furfurilactobacillus siliginis]
MFFVTQLRQLKARDATLKPKEDFTLALSELGFATLGIERYDTTGLTEKEKNERIAGQVGGVSGGDVVVYQYPNYMWAVYETEMIRQMKSRGATVIGMIHDVDYLRFEAFGKASDIVLFNEMDALIVLSKKMRTQLAADGVTVPMIVRGPWDYFINVPLPDRHFSTTISYAGNLEATKAGFLDTFPADLHLELYGVGLDETRTLPDSVTYQGSQDPDMLSSVLADGFGLVWDGNTSETIAGNYGDYLTYNLSHKLSLYLGSGLPVIINEQDSCAEFVRQNKLGIVVKSLTELPDVFAGLDEKRYGELLANVNKVGNLIKHGRFAQMAVLAALRTLNLQYDDSFS